MKRVMALMLMVAIGLGFYLYPEASQWYMQRQDYGLDASAAQIAHSRADDENAELLANAVSYNEALWGIDVQKTFLERSAATDIDYQVQLRDPARVAAKLLETGSDEAVDPGPTRRNPLALPGGNNAIPGALTAADAMGRVSIPSIDISMPIYHGATEEALARGAGHVYGTSLPVGGPSTHSVITAHSRQGKSGRFNRIRELQIGDEFFITAAGQTMRYVVDRIDTVLPDEVEYLQIIPGEDHVTLLTCTPLGLNTHRLLVRGVRAPMAVHGAPEPAAKPMPFPSWAVWLGSGVALSGLAGAAINKATMPKKKKGLVELATEAVPDVADSVAAMPDLAAITEVTPQPMGRHLRRESAAQ